MEVLDKEYVEKYQAYKDSDVSWLGEIPKHWATIKLKFIAKLYNGDSLNDREKSAFESNDKRHLAYISTKDIDYDRSIIEYDTGLKIPIQNNKLKVAPKGSFLLCIEGGSAGKKIAYLSQDVCFVNKLCCFLVDEKYSSKYYYHYSKSRSFQNQFSLAMTGLIGGVAISTIKNFNTYLPPLSEQTRIAQFLDRKTEQIDQAIAQKEKQIALLKERRQILINKAVTRGINPNAQLKDSGVEWIGEIPEHWEVVKNRILFQERNEPGNETLPLLSVSIHTAVSSEELSDEENIRGKIRIEDKSKYKLVEVGDVAFNMMRAWQGAIGSVSTKGMVSPAYVVAKPKRFFNSDFFEYQYRTEKFIQQMDRSSKGITDFRKRLYWNEFKQLNTILPPEDEQNDIAIFISKLNELTERAMVQKNSEIEKLKEYKATLINSAVTGKIKVC